MSKKKTNEEFLKDIEEKFGKNKFTPKEEYKGYKEKIGIYCEEGEHDFYAFPSKFLSKGCPICNKNNAVLKIKQKAIEEFHKIFDENFPNTILLEEYVNENEKIKLYCTDCNLRFSTYFCVLKEKLKRGETVCIHKYLKITEEYFYDFFNNNNDNGEYLLLSDFKSYKESVKILHLKCNTEYETKALNFLKGMRCPICSMHTLTKEEFKEEFNKLDRAEEYEQLTEYVNMTTFIYFRHIPCNYEFYITPSRLFSEGNLPCTRCFGTEIITEEDAKRKMKEKFGEDIIIEEFNGWTEKSLLYCTRCDTRSYRSLARVYEEIFGCDICFRKASRGPGSVNWQGGIQSISSVLRNGLNQWKMDSRRFYGYACIISGEYGTTDDDIIIHHVIKPFSDIRDEILEKEGYTVDYDMMDLSEEEINRLIEKIRKIHYMTGYGVPIKASLHREFHSKYGNKNNTVEQFIEFAESKGVKLSLLDNYLIKGDIIDEDE